MMFVGGNKKRGRHGGVVNLDSQTIANTQLPCIAPLNYDDAFCVTQDDTEQHQQSAARRTARRHPMMSDNPDIRQTLPPPLLFDIDDDDDDNKERGVAFGSRKQQRKCQRQQQQQRQQQEQQCDEIKPGAVRVGGKHGDDDDDDVEQLSLAPTMQSQVMVVEAVHEDQLYEEMLLQRNVVQAETATPLKVENADEVQEDNNNCINSDAAFLNEEKGKCRGFTTKRIVMAGGLAVIIIIVLATVLSSRSTQTEKLNIIMPSTQPMAATNNSRPSVYPTPAPVPRLDVLRSILVNHSISSENDLDSPGSSQYQALSWLAFVDNAMLDVSNTSLLDDIVDRYVMATVYYASNGPQWYDKSNFLSSESICMWHNTATGQGIYCNPLKIELASNNLVGSIISEFRHLTNLEHLNLQSNQFAGSISAELFLMTALTHLDLRYNQFYGVINSSIGILSNLNYLDVNHNALVGAIPTEMGKLTNLLHLDLGGNDRPVRRLVGSPTTTITTTTTYYRRLQAGFSSSIPTELGRLSKLQYLNLNNGIFVGSVPTVLAALPNLTTLILTENNLNGNLTRFFCDGVRSTPWQDFEADCGVYVQCSCCNNCA